MYGFPIQLYPVPQGMFDDQSVGFGAGIQREIFYSIKDGNWNDMSIWETVSGRVGSLPSAVDDVYIRNSIVCSNISNTSCHNLYISGVLYGISNRTLNVLGNIQAVGAINTVGTSFTLSLYGVDNYINPNLFLPGISSTINYAGPTNQIILPLAYTNLKTSGTGIKYVNSELVVTGLTTVGEASILEVHYDCVFNSLAVSDRVGSSFSVPVPVNIIFNGFFRNGFNNTINLWGNPTIECRAGFFIYGLSNIGSNRIKITTNNQTCTFEGSFSAYDAIEIDSPITVTWGASTSGILYTTTAIPSVAGATLINNGNIYHDGHLAEVTAGSFDYLTLPNTMGYLNNTALLPYTTYSSLYIRNGSFTVSGNLTLTANLRLELSGLNLDSNIISVTGTSVISQSTLISSGGTSILIGTLSTTSSVPAANFSGTAKLELRGGISNTGTSQINSDIVFTTNNQTVRSSSGFLSLNNLCTISGSITISTQVGNNLIITSNINGDNAGSTFAVLNNLFPNYPVDYQGDIKPMVTGILTLSADSYFTYRRAGNQEIRGGNYFRLEFGGSGVKKLMGNVIVNTTAGGSWSITGSATIDYNGFTITTI